MKTILMKQGNCANDVVRRITSSSRVQKKRHLPLWQVRVASVSGPEQVPASAELPFVVPWIVDLCHDGSGVFDMFVAANPSKNEDFDN